MFLGSGIGSHLTAPQIIDSQKKTQRKNKPNLGTNATLENLKCKLQFQNGNGSIKSPSNLEMGWSRKEGNTPKFVRNENE